MTTMILHEWEGFAPRRLIYQPPEGPLLQGMVWVEDHQGGVWRPRDRPVPLASGHLPAVLARQLLRARLIQSAELAVRMVDIIQRASETACTCPVPCSGECLRAAALDTMERMPRGMG